MIRIAMTTGGHKWEKTNLVTLQDKQGLGFDTYQCKECGLKAKRYSFEELRINERSSKKAMRCPALKDTKRIKIIRCMAVGPQFTNLTPGSIHEVIAPPAGEHNKNGEWVMGVGEPVKVLIDEYRYIGAEE